MAALRGKGLKDAQYWTVPSFSEADTGFANPGENAAGGAAHLWGSAVRGYCDTVHFSGAEFPVEFPARHCGAGGGCRGIFGVISGQ